MKNEKKTIAVARQLCRTTHRILMKTNINKIDENQI